MHSKRLGILKISVEYMEDLLGLHDKIHIKKCYMDHDDPWTIRMVVESPYLEELPEGALIPTVTKEQLEGYDE